MVDVPMVPHAEFGQNDHQEYALHFILKRLPDSSRSIFI